MTSQTTTDDKDKTSKPYLEEWLKNNPQEAKEITGRMTGHDIFKPEVLEEMPEHLREKFVKTHESGDHHKSTIYVNGQPVDELTGVDGKTVLSRFKTALGVSTEVYNGRGFQAQADKKAIKEKLEELGA